MLDYLIRVEMRKLRNISPFFIPFIKGFYIINGVLLLILTNVQPS